MSAVPAGSNGAALGRPVVLVVASWYPSVDSATSGGFIADQVHAVAADGRFAPVVASFDPLPLWGSSRLRQRQAAAVRQLASAGLSAPGAGAFVSMRGRNDTAVPVAWLPVPGNAGGAGGSDRPAHERSEVLGVAVAAIDRVAGAPAIVHAHTGFPDGAAAAVDAARRGVPLIVTEHASTLGAVASDPLRRARYIAAASSAARFVTVSARLGAQVLELAPDVEPRLVVLPNVVDVDLFADTGREPRRRDELLYVGNRKHSKGIAVLLEAFAIARAARPSLRLRLIGGAPPSLDEAWRRKAGELGIADAVAFEPEADRAGVAAAMARADLFVHPSPRETFGVVAAEALAAGLPVVAADSGGVTEVLGPDAGANGAVVPAGDPAALAAAIVAVLARREQFSAEELRARAVARFSPGVVAGRLAEIYAEAIAEHPGRQAEHAAPVAASMPAPRAERLVVVGFDARRAERVLAATPLVQRSSTAVVTAGGALDLPRSATVAEVPALARRHASLQGVGSVAAAASPSRRRRALLARPWVILAEAWQRAPWRERSLLRAASRAIAAVGAGGGSLVVLDGFDALAAEVQVRNGVLVAAPGAGRWLAAAGTQDPDGSPTA